MTFQKSKMADGCHLENPIKFLDFKNPNWRTAALLKVKKHIISTRIPSGIWLRLNGEISAIEILCPKNVGQSSPWMLLQKSSNMQNFVAIE